ncbi:MAG: HAMP domain-containing protein [Anaerolineales bacterium]|nr:MAG: HAMP domain-containing protein [Anaerolineales bacterium]
MTYTFLQSFPFLSILAPTDLLGWLAWLILLGASVALALRLGGRGVLWTRKQQLRLLALVLAVPLSILLFTLRMPADGALPIPSLGVPAIGALIAPLLAIPWMLALVWYGAPAATALAAFGGLLLAAWDTRSPFTPLEFGLLAAAFAYLRSQRYGTALFAWLRQPLVAAAALSLLYPILFIGSALFWVSPSWLVSFDFALSRMPGAALAAAAPLLIGALVLQVALARRPQLERTSEPSQPAPSERSLEARFLFALAPLAALAFVVMGALTWWTVGRGAQQLFADRIANNVQIAADSVPFVLETGQNLILQLASDTRLADAGPQQAAGLLQAQLNGAPYFEQLSLLDTGGNSVAGIPAAEYARLQPSQAELNAVALAIQGVSLQILSAPPAAGADQTSAQLVFVAAVRNSNGQVRNVLVGRTAWQVNPFARPVVQSLQSINTLGAQALLVDARGQIAVAPFAAAVLQPYSGQTGPGALSYEDAAADGTRLLVQYQPVSGSNWAVVARWPASLSQQLALSVALPILSVLLLLALVAYILLRRSLQSVSASLHTLAAETQRIASGDLRAPLSVTGTDEVGRLGSAFEVMRRAVLARTEVTQRLLALSHGLSSSLEVRSHIEPLLEAALASGASLARLVFLGDNGGSGLSFGKGEGYERYEALDAQMLALTQGQEQVLLANPARARLKVDKGTPYPGSVAAFALKDGRKQLGALWLAYDQPQRFEPGSGAVHYLETLAAQASTAATNARQYLQARLGQQRLEAVLQADPQPMLMLDAGQNVVFANPAAARILRLRPDHALGLPVEQVITERSLLALLRAAGPRPHSTEVLIDKAAYEATLNPLWAGPELLGFVCTLQDVTQSKKLESARLEALSTVGHDLQDPLKMVSGYLSMLSVLGPLNDQQKGYVQKIDASIEQIARLSASLLAADRMQEAEGLRPENLALSEVLQAALAEAAPQARQKQIELVLQPAEGAERLLRADRTLLQRAVFYLLDNAIRFSPRGRSVRVGASYADGAVVLRVKDSGAGIAPVDLPRIFERREGQAATTGLHIVRSIIQRHKGKVWAESDLGVGSSFYCQLPLSES